MERTQTIAGVILGIVFILMLGSVWNDSATMDELAHIPAGFSYVTALDMRLNPEHPPLLKDLAGLSTLMFVQPYFSISTPHWRDDVNGQWAQGAEFLYGSGNDADQILFWSRLPLIMLTVFFGWLLFRWTKNRFGSTPAFLTLLLFAFSPTFLTHGRYVTTDVGAAFGFFLGTITFLNFLESPRWKNIGIAGLVFGLAQLLKFSLILLIPLYGILLIVWVIVQPNLHLHERIRVFFRFLGKTVVIGLIGIAMIWGVYTFHVWNYPQERQLRDAEFILTSFPGQLRFLADFDLALIKNRFTRPFGQYGLGFLMVSQRTGGGNTAFFLGEVSAAGSQWYFPILYLVKESFAFHILTLITLYSIIRFQRQKSSHGKIKDRLRFWLETHFAEFSALAFVVLYWFTSLISPLNIGIRHVLPTFPFIYILVSKQITQWLRSHEFASPETWGDLLRNLHSLYTKAAPKYILTGLLFIWLIFDTLAVYPYFMSYYNTLGGGARNGYRIAVDSNYDWGQDLKRLAAYVEKNQIEKIAVDYFGGGNPRYYLGEKFEPWRSSQGPASGWFAISATFRQGAFGKTAPGFIRKPEDSYEWLKEYEPVGRAGYSIFIYKLP